MDQATPANQGLLRHHGECRQNPDMDCRLGLCARGHHQKMTQARGSLYTILQILSVTIFERTPLLQVLTDSDYNMQGCESLNQLNLFD